MNDTIKNFYEENNLPKPLWEQKLKKFEKHKDIADEFKTWIIEKKYKEDDAVTVEGYTAKKLSELSQYLNGDGAFMMLIELRENPKKAINKITGGIKIK